MDSQSEIGHFLQKLSKWRDESNKEFSNILTFHSSSINKGINDLVEEVSDLKVELSLIKKERNDLLETVHNLSNDIRKGSAELPIQQPMPETEEMYSNDIPEAISCIPDVEVDNKQNIEVSNINSETNDPDETTFNESGNLDEVEYARDEEVTNKKVSDENCEQEETLGGIGKSNSKAMPRDLITTKSFPYESKNSENIVQDDDHVCPECNFAFSTRENLGIHLQNLHPGLKITNNRETGNKKFTCEQCPYTSPKSSRIRRHIETVHKNIWKHVCGECGYAASYKSDLKRHIDGVHKDIKNHVCEKCGFAASQKANLRKHIEAVHDNIKNNV